MSLLEFALTHGHYCTEKIKQWSRDEENEFLTTTASILLGKTFTT